MKKKKKTKCMPSTQTLKPGNTRLWYLWTENAAHAKKKRLLEIGIWLLCNSELFDQSSF